MFCLEQVDTFWASPYQDCEKRFASKKPPTHDEFLVCSTLLHCSVVGNILIVKVATCVGIEKLRIFERNQFLLIVTPYEHDK